MFPFGGLFGGGAAPDPRDLLDLLRLQHELSTLDSQFGSRRRGLGTGGGGGLHPSMRRSRQAAADDDDDVLGAYEEIRQSIQQDCRQRGRAYTHAPIQPDPPVGFFSLAPLRSLAKMPLSDLRPGFLHMGRYLLVRTKARPYKLRAVFTVVEDEQGQLRRLSLYGFVPKLQGVRSGDLSEHLPPGTILAIKEPYYKIGDGDGKPFIRVDSKSDVLLLTAAHPLAAGWGNQGSLSGNGSFTAPACSPTTSTAALTAAMAEGQEPSGQETAGGPVGVDAAQRLRQQGVEFLAARCYVDAMDCFLRALDCLGPVNGAQQASAGAGSEPEPDTDKGRDEAGQRTAQLRVDLLGHCSEACLQLGTEQAAAWALGFAEAVLTLSPGQSKALHRKGRALLGLRWFAQAADALEACRQAQQAQQELAQQIISARAMAVQQHQGRYDWVKLLAEAEARAGARGNAAAAEVMPRLSSIAEYVGPVHIEALTTGEGEGGQAKGRGRGRGLVVTRDVAAGELLLACRAEEAVAMGQVVNAFGAMFDHASLFCGTFNSPTHGQLIKNLVPRALGGSPELQRVSLLHTGRSSIGSGRAFRPGGSAAPQGSALLQRESMDHLLSLCLPMSREQVKEVGTAVLRALGMPAEGGGGEGPAQAAAGMAAGDGAGSSINGPVGIASGADGAGSEGPCSNLLSVLSSARTRWLRSTPQMLEVQDVRGSNNDTWGLSSGSANNDSSGSGAGSSSSSSSSPVFDVRPNDSFLAAVCEANLFTPDPLPTIQVSGPSSRPGSAARGSAGAGSGSGADEISKSSGLYALPSLINHACAESACRHFIGDFMFVHAVKDMAAGEEITVSYCDPLEPFSERASKLRKYGFTCSCSLCTEEQQQPQVQGLVREFNGKLRDSALGAIRALRAGSQARARAAPVVNELRRMLKELQELQAGKQWASASFGPATALGQLLHCMGNAADSAAAYEQAYRALLHGPARMLTLPPQAAAGGASGAGGAAASSGGSSAGGSSSSNDKKAKKKERGRASAAATAALDPSCLPPAPYCLHPAYATQTCLWVALQLVGNGKAKSNPAVRGWVGLARSHWVTAYGGLATMEQQFGDVLRMVA